MKKLLQALSRRLSERNADAAASIHEGLFFNGPEETWILNARLRALDTQRH